MQQHSDQQLIALYLGGDEVALDILIKRHFRAIYGFVFSYVKNKELAEDITQETFLKVFRNIKKIDKNKSFKSWVYTIAKNTALDYFKKKKSVAFSSFEDATGKNVLMEVLADKAKQPHELAELLEDSSLFLGAIKTLSAKYQQILLMYYYEYLNFREIAEKLQEPINTIKSRHRRGLVLLKQQVYAPQSKFGAYHFNVRKTR